MRITNRMMTNNMLSNINNNKNRMAFLEEQYTSGKKIQKPSDDPIIAVRALKFRTNLSELEQYLEKNIPDASSWMKITEGTFRTLNETLEKINTVCNQGSSDTLEPKNRAAIIEDLKEMREQIYKQGNNNLAGRYIFSGYKTDSTFLFEEKTNHLEYTINESFSGSQIDKISTVYGEYSIADLDDTSLDLKTSPQRKEAYRLRLSYANTETGAMISTDTGPLVVTEKSQLDKDAYSPGDNETYYIKETGEFIFGKDVYNDIKNKDLQVVYRKNSFNEGEPKPEHYFNVEVNDTNKPGSPPIQYFKSKQDIQYEVSFNQRISINVEGSNVFTHSLGRDIDEIEKRVQDVIDVENKIEVLKKRLEDVNLSPADKERINDLLEHFNTELVLKKDMMQKAFGKGISSASKQIDIVNTASADIGSRMVRLNLTEDRLLNQKDEFTELMSTNEDVNQVEALIKLTSALDIYTASLSATAKSIKNSLLDFL